MPIRVPIAIPDDVETDEDFRKALQLTKRSSNAIGSILALHASEVGAMLKPWDESADQRNRRKKVTRVLAAASAAQYVVSRLLKLADSRFKTLYAEEIEHNKTAARRQREQAPRRRGAMRMGV